MIQNFHPINTKQCPEYEKKLRREGGWSLPGVLIGIALGLIALAGIGEGVSNALNNMDIGDTETDLNFIRMEAKQVYTSSPDYTGLNNAVARNSGIIPSSMNKSNGIRNEWNGNVTVAVDNNDPNTFVITLESIPQEACTKLATYGAGSWQNVSVNGSDLNQASIVSDASTKCVASNTIAFTSD